MRGGMARVAGLFAGLGHSVTRRGGFSLAEVLVATAIAMTLLLPLASQFVSLNRRVDAFVNRPLPGRSLTHWDWGPSPGHVELKEQGIEVYVRDVGYEQAAFVGLWSNGWFLEERAVEPGASVVLARDRHWSAEPLTELVVRVRKHEGPWGPPRRLVASPHGASGAESTDSAVLVHLPEVGEFVLKLTSSVETTTTGSSPWRQPVPSGTLDLAAAGAEEAWQSESGRDLDVYF